MNKPANDAELVARCKRGLPYQHAAFEQLVLRYKNMVFTLCYRLVGNAAQSEELMQEVFTKVFLNLQGFEERSSFSSWLYRITYNHCLNFLDKRKRELAGMQSYVEDRELRQQATAGIGKVSDLMQHALDQLSEDQRALLIMKYVMELELVEIGRILDLGLSAVKMRLFRAREEFRRHYPQTAGEQTGNLEKDDDK